MKKLILILIFLLPGLLRAQLTVKEILAHSASLYDSFSYGKIILEYRFKSPIAESSSTSRMCILFCRPAGIVINESVSENRSLCLSGNNYYIFDNNKKTYQERSTEEDMKRNFLQELAQYPFYGSGFFDEAANAGLKLIQKDGIFELYNPTIHIYIDTASFSVLGYRETRFSQFGMQEKEWRVIKQESGAGCDETIVSYVSARTGIYRKISGNASRINPGLNGKKISTWAGDWNPATINKGIISQEELKKRFILLDFFTQSCMPCIASFPYIKKLQARFADSGKLLILGLDPNPDDSASMLKFIRRYRLEYAVIAGQEAAQLNATLNPEGIFPYYIFIQPGGKVLLTRKGFSKRFFSRVTRILAKKA